MLVWCEEHSRILVSYDKRTLPLHFADHLATGHHCPGIFMFSLRHALPEIVEFLALATHASTSEEWVDRIFYVE